MDHYALLTGIADTDAMVQLQSLGAMCEVSAHTTPAFVLYTLTTLVRTHTTTQLHTPTQVLTLDAGLAFDYFRPPVVVPLLAPFLENTQNADMLASEVASHEGSKRSRMAPPLSATHQMLQRPHTPAPARTRTHTLTHTLTHTHTPLAHACIQMALLACRVLCLLLDAVPRPTGQICTRLGLGAALVRRLVDLE